MRPLRARGLDKVMATTYLWKCPAAQYGVKSFWCAVALPVAVPRPQLVQWSPVKEKFPSPQATTIDAGRTSGGGQRHHDSCEGDLHAWTILMKV